MKNLGGYKRDNGKVKDLLANLPFETLQMMEHHLSRLAERRSVDGGAAVRGTKRAARARSRQDPT